MAKKYYDGDIKNVNINTDWGGDASTSGAPLPGSMVQQLIKNEINSKVGYMYNDTRDGKVFFYSNSESHDKGEEPIGFVEYEQNNYLEMFVDKKKNLFFSTEDNKSFKWYFRTRRKDYTIYPEPVNVIYTITNSKNETRTISRTISPSPTGEDGYTEVIIEKEEFDSFFTNGKSILDIRITGSLTKQVAAAGDNEISIITINFKDKTSFNTKIETELKLNCDVNCTLSQPFYIEYFLDENSENAKLSDEFKGAGKTENYNCFLDLTGVEDGFHVCTYRLILPIDSTEYNTEYQRIEFVKNESNTYATPHVLLYSKYNEGDEIKKENDLVINGVSQYNSFDLPYSLYNENNGSLNVKFTDIENGNVLAEQVVSSYELINLDIQMLNYGLTKIKIEAFKDSELVYERFFYLNVIKSEMLIDIATTNLRVDFNSVGKSNSDLDKKSWISTVRSENKASFNDDFDWSQGWTKDGIVVSKNSEIVFNYAPFPYQNPSENEQSKINDYVGGYDKSYTFEIEFKTQNVTNDDVLLCNMVSDNDTYNCGLIITGTQIKFTTPGSKSISTRFKSGEMIRAAIVVRPNVYVDEKGEEIFKGLVELYVNGVLSSIASYAGEKFEIVEIGESGIKSKNLSFKGSEDGEIVIKHIRTYMTALSSDSILNNYILYRTNTSEMLSLYNKNNILDINTNSITPKSIIEWGNIPVLVFIGRTYAPELAPGETGATNANSIYHYQTLENTSDKNFTIEMDVVYYDPKNPEKNFKFVKAAVRPQGTSSMLYPKKNFRIYTQRSKDTRLFFSNDEYGTLTFDDMMISNFGENAGDDRYELKVSSKDQKLYSFKKNAQPVKCWCLKADFAETSSSHNTGIARLWGDTMKNSTVKIGENEIPVLKTNAQEKIEKKYLGKENEKDMPDVRTTIDGFPIVVFAKKAYGNWEPGATDIDSSYVFLGKYNFNNDKSTESVFGFCDIDTEQNIKSKTKDINGNEGEITHSIDDMLDKYMSCIETLDNGNDLANFAVMDKDKDSGSWDNNWDKVFEFRYPEIPEKPTEPNKDDYDDENKYNEDYNKYLEDLTEYNQDIEKWNNRHLKPFKHFAQWVYDTRYCDVNGNILKDELQTILNSNSGLKDENGKLITTVQELADFRQRKFNKEKWEHLDVWKVAAYYIYVMRFGAVDQVVKNSMLTSEGPFSYNDNGEKYGYWDSNPEDSNDYGRYYKWYYINYDNDTIMGVKNDGSLAYGPNIQRTSKDEGNNYIYAGSNSTLWNNLDNDTEFQNIVRKTDKGITRRLTYDTALKMFDVEQVGKWCERIYNKDADYKYVSPYVGNWIYKDASGNTVSDEKEKFSNKLFMLQGSRIAHRHWWLYNRFNLFDGKWGSGDFSSKFIEIKCDYNTTGGVFKAIAGSDSYYGYSINNVVFGKNESGETQEYKYGTEINWKLCKNINIGDPIAIFGSMDISELNLEGISKNLSEIQFNGANFSEQNKLEHLKLSIPDEDLNKNAYYQVLDDYTEAIILIKDNFEGKYKDTIFTEEQFKEGGDYFNSENIEYDATSKNSPDFYCIKTITVKDDKEVIVYLYFVKLEGKVRNRSINVGSFSLAPLSKLQTLEMRGYATLPSLDLKSNRFITKLDVAYSSVKSVTFSEGSRITEFYASDSLNTLDFIRCNNITLQNIYINENPLKKDGGINLNNITIDNSDGLNHSNDFRDFIINWLNGDELDGFKPLNGKKLVLYSVKWTNVTMNHINTLLYYKETYPDNSVITGTLTLSDSLNYSQSDIEKIEKLISLYGKDFHVNFGSVNILIDEVGDIVAKNNENHEGVTIGCSINTIGNEIIDYLDIKYAFLKEVPYNTGDYYDGNKDKTYKVIDPSEIRGVNKDGESNVTLIKNNTDGTVLLKTEEFIFGTDVDVLLGVIYENGPITKLDVTSFKIKDPTYAVKGELNGQLLLNEINTEYVYDLNLKTIKDKSPIGTVYKKWDITFENEDDARFIASSGLTNDNCRLTILTSDETPIEISRFTITVEISNKLNNLEVSPIRQTFVIINNNIIMTNETNPTVMTILKNNNIIDKNAESLSKTEAANITNEQIKTIFKGITANTWTFDEFYYFTNITRLANEAFKDSKLVSIKLPDSLEEVGDSVFENCKQLKNITLSENLESISKKMFLNCSNLSYIILPSNVVDIGENAFGNVGLKKILFNDGKIYDDKTLYIYENSLLKYIENSAFEIETDIIENNTVILSYKGFNVYNGKLITNNTLEEIHLPQRLQLSSNYYQFLLGPNINKLVLSKNNTNIVIENNIVYVDKEKTTIARGLPLFYGEQIDKIELPNVSTVLDFAFFKCDSINKIVFDEEINKYGIGLGAFFQSKIESIDLSKSNQLVYLKDYTFYDIDTLKNISLPLGGNLVIFGTYMFYNSPLLETLVLPDTLLKFEGTYSYFISSCGIKTFTIPEKIFEVPMYLILNCSDLEEITYSPFFKISQRYSMVSSCSKLKNIILPLFSKTVANKNEYVVKYDGHIIGWFDSENNARTFRNDFVELHSLDNRLSFNEEKCIIEPCTVDANIKINGNFYPKGRITTFENCKNVETFTMHSDDNNKIFTITNEGVDGETETEPIKKGKTIIRLNEDGTKTLVKIAYSISNYTISSSISYIEQGAFAHTGIREIIIPNTVKKIGSGAFQNCNYLTTVTFNKRDDNNFIIFEDSTDEGLFSNCGSLTNVVFNTNNISSMPIKMFYKSGITGLTIPSKVERIGYAAFSECVNLKTVTFSENSELKKIDSATYFGEGVFEGCTSITKIELPEKLEVIGQRAFFNCTNLEEVVILSKKLDKIEQFAFVSCYNLGSIKLLTTEVNNYGSTIPIIEKSNDYIELKEDKTKFYLYHPFGWKDNFTGSRNISNNKFYIPFNKENDYKNSEDWSNPLLHVSGCNFTIETLSLLGEYNLTESEYTRNTVLSNYPLIYAKSESGNYNPKTGILNNGDNTFTFTFNNDVYDNETIIIYSDSTKKDEIGRFVVRYGIQNYVFGDVILSSNKPSLFNTNLFTTEVVEEEVEMANITKLEYEMLLAKIDQLSRLIKLKK